MTAAESRVQRQYAETHRRLASDPTYIELTRAAAAEAATTPNTWLARNRLALHVEVNMPPIAPEVIDPDCTAGKHPACPGWSWDDTNDRPAPCECPCHDPEETSR